MTRQDGKRMLLFILLIFWMGLIFFFSAKPAVQSAKMSTSVGKMIGRVVVPEFEEWSDTKQDAFAKKIDFAVRKSAHACEYAALSVLFFVNYKKKSRKIKQIVGMSALNTALYAVTDEIHQLFVPGRSGQITDVILDSCGGLIGAVLSAIILYLIRKRKKDGS